MSVARAVRYLKRELWLRPLPHGLFSWRYLLPSQNSHLRLHRQLWWNHPRRIPRILWLMAELWLWLRWVSFGAWRSTWRVVRTLGPEIATREHLSLRLQGWRTLCLAIGWCIPPKDVYRFQLYRKPEAALHYAYDHEIASYHRWRNTERGLTQASLELLQDKQQLATELAGLGVPVIQEVACVAHNADADLINWLKSGDILFCKTRSGSRGEGAFTVWMNTDDMQGQMLDGTALENSVDVEKAWHALLKLDDALVQTRQLNHPLLAPLAAGEDAITVRFISQWRGDTLTCLSTTLEIPVGHSEKSGHPLYCILPIASQNGHLNPFPEDALCSEQARSQMQQVWTKVNAGFSLPYWDELVSASYLAHQRFPDIWGIAWDWVITPDGPRLLEGNTGWGTATPQMLAGGFVARDTAST